LENKELTADNATIAKEAKRRSTQDVARSGRAIKLLELSRSSSARRRTRPAATPITRSCALQERPHPGRADRDAVHARRRRGQHAADGGVRPGADQGREKLLIDRGILAKPYFRFVESKPHPKLRKTSPWQRAYSSATPRTSSCNADIVHYAKRAQHGLPVLTLVQRKNHGATLCAMMEALRAAGVFMQGENDQDEREARAESARGGKIDVVIGSTIVDVGVDVPAIGLVQLAGGGKAEVALRQRIGRGLRAKKTGPTSPSSITTPLARSAGTRPQSRRTTA
jgi:hypothetical protein